MIKLRQSIILDHSKSTYRRIESKTNFHSPIQTKNMTAIKNMSSDLSGLDLMSQSDVPMTALKKQGTLGGRT